MYFAPPPKYRRMQVVVLLMDAHVHAHTHTHTHIVQSQVCQKRLDHAARSADFSPDGQQVVVGLSNGEFLLLSANDLTTLAHKRDRSKTIRVVR